CFPRVPEHADHPGGVEPRQPGVGRHTGRRGKPWASHPEESVKISVGPAMVANLRGHRSAGEVRGGSQAMRRHRSFARRSGRRVALTVAGAMLVGAAAAAVGQSWWGDTRASATSGVRDRPAPAAHRPARPPALSNLGEVRGTYQIPGPATAPRGSWVIFAVDGPRRLVRNDLTAPFSFPLDTRALPDGRYTVTVLLVLPGSTAQVWSRGIQVANGPTGPIPPLPTMAPPPAPPSTRPAPGPNSPPGYATEVLRLTNQQRTANGCRPLT